MKPVAVRAYSSPTLVLNGSHAPKSWLPNRVGFDGPPEAKG
jgi:hypothetical protein